MVRAYTTELKKRFGADKTLRDLLKKRQAKKADTACWQHLQQALAVIKPLKVLSRCSQRRRNIGTHAVVVQNVA
jgi:hypothetical protein